ncbi:hypothetical protein P170DRAFT_513400 [Aspergillus steynii IBT 23096]|uniref:Cytochrome b5 heme-binding domain-containing protein n=1 Tax=Aspergillus steynii IBT 23096 TaxID=1392250 RepID=A0A2I2FUA1_9EURO|nr:uncharacterized protein P170DRAFT_513400 [Aspergillus steynii IBT 23096]PLB44146.1 hypothetical protein P170DRAFT_513400 [Aspergillus steynii IBT 23096]
MSQSPLNAITVHTREDVARHNRSADLWVIIDKEVYDLTNFQAEHPGGDRILRRLAGQDASKEFHENHRESLFNEGLRLAERRVPFNVDALSTAICKAANKPANDLTSITKIAEGGFNRILQATFRDGYEVISRIPYNSTVPKHYAVASEAATLGLLRANGLPVPKVLGYSPDRTNAVGTEYLLLEKLQGSPLSDQWFTMDNKARVKIMKQIVDLERRFMTIEFPASGSLYYRRDLNAQAVTPVNTTDEAPGPDDLVVGPIALQAWWYGERALLDTDRGPWKDFTLCFGAPAKREIEFCNRYGKPRFHYERYLRQIYSFEKQLPEHHVNLLFGYLKLSPYLTPPPDHPFSRPTLRHPDLSPNNILVNDSHEITGLIDWQHAAILPLCLCAGIPTHFQNWGDPASATLGKPEVELPDNFDQLDEREQACVRETIRKRLVHFFYAALTMRQVPDHFDVLTDENATLRIKLFNCAGAPWEGNSLGLQYALVQAHKNWPMGDATGSAASTECPVQFSEEEIQNVTDYGAQEDDLMQDLSQMRDVIGIDTQGWVADDEQLQVSVSVARQIRDGMLEHCESEIERTAIVEHFPFEDHDEEGLN